MDLVKELRPLYASMALVGLFHPPNPTNPTNSITPSLAASPRRRRKPWARAYCYIVTALLWFSFLRYIPSFWVGVDFHPELLVERVLHVVWYFNNAVMASVFISYCQNPKHMVKLENLWDTFSSMYREAFNEGGTKSDTDGAPDALHACGGEPTEATTCSFWSVLKGCLPSKSVTPSWTAESEKAPMTSSKLRKIVFRNVIVAWIMIFLHFIMVVVFVFGGLRTDFGVVICNPFPDTLPVEVFFLMTHFLDVCAWTFPTAFTCTTCSVLHLCFSQLTEMIKKSVFREKSFLDEKHQTRFDDGDDVNKAGSVRATTPEKNLPSGQSCSISTETCDSNTSHSTVYVLNATTNNRCNRKLNLDRLKGIHSDTLHDENLKSVAGNTFRQDFPENLESVRRLHLHLCACVNVLDRTLNRVVMITYLTSIPQTCFLLYMMVNAKHDVFTLFVLVFWIVSNVLQTTLISVSCARVHEAAHKPLHYLYHVNVAHTRSHQRDQLGLFISKLTGPAIGFTAFGIIAVTKEMMLTVGGLLVTYFFLLLQFSI